MTVYFFSGLGADETVFQKLVLPRNFKVVYIKWLEAEKGDTLKADVRIEKGGHFMVYNRAEEFSTFIVNEISKKCLS